MSAPGRCGSCGGYHKAKTTCLQHSEAKKRSIKRMVEEARANTQHGLVYSEDEGIWYVPQQKD